MSLALGTVVLILLLFWVKKKFCRQDKTTCTFLLCDLVGHMVTAFESNYFLIVVSLVSKDMSSGQ